MSATAKILWGEGLFLRPQHFQRQDAYHEARLVQAMRWMLPQAWGLAALEVDEDALAAGLLRVLSLQAVMPDGEFVCAPRDDELPEPVDLGPGFTADWELVLEPLRPDACNYAAGDDRRLAARFAAHPVPAGDWFTGAPEAELVVLRRRPRLQPAGGSQAALPLLRLSRRAAGGCELDRRFVPPALTLAAAPALLALQRRLLDRLRERCAALHGLPPQPGRHVVELRSGDVAAFWLLHTASAAHARLMHLGSGVHPEQLFGALLELAGALAAFTPGRGPADLPAYRHAAPAAGFEALEALVHEGLEAVVSTRCTTIAFDEPRPSWHLASLQAVPAGPGCALYLAVQAEMPMAALIEAVPARLKIGSPEDVERLVHTAVAGVRLVPAAQLPAALPLAPGACCFLVEPLGPFHDRMRQAGAMAVHAPEGLPRLRLVLHAVAG